jgi:hypothetical protein
MPGFSAVHVEIEGMPNHPVRIYKGEEEEYILSTRGRAEQGVFAVEFKPLGPGFYRVEPDALGIWATVELTGLEAVRVSFRRKLEPVGPHRVEPISPAVPEPAANSAATYLYLSTSPTTLEASLALLRLAAARQPEIGSDLAAAARAGVVLLVDAPDAGDVEAYLRGQGVRVERVGAA